MATYEESGVNIEMGDQCSAIAYAAAKGTFPGRAGMIGQPVVDDGGFAGALDMGDYYLIQNDDGIGTKMIIAEAIGQYDTMGYDLVAMVADDAICVGAETISISNTLAVDKVQKEKIQPLMAGLQKAALEQKIVIPGGEIAELGSMSNGYIWNATSVGIVAKDKMITGKEIQAGDTIIAFASAGLRSNGFSLVRHILKEKFGEDCYNQPYNDSQTWGQAVLTPCRIYSAMLLDLIGRYQQPAKAHIKGLVHVTGGGLPGNITRVLKNGLGADLTLPETPELFTKLMELGNVARDEAYKTWNMGIGMIAICAPEEAEKILAHAQSQNFPAQTIGQVNASGQINF